MLEVFLDSINLTHYLPKIALVVINPCIVVVDLQRGVTHHFPHALDLLRYFIIIHYANRYHLVKSPKILLHIHDASIFISLRHSVDSWRKVNTGEVDVQSTNRDC